jgi:hypothetical protein
MDLSFFFTHLSQDVTPGAPWVAFRAPLRGSASDDRTLQMEASPVTDSSEGRIELWVEEGQDNFTVDTDAFFDASSLITSDYNQMVTTLEASLSHPLAPAQMQQSLYRHLPVGQGEEEQTLEWQFPQEHTYWHQLDASHVGEFDASTGGDTLQFLTPITYDIDADRLQELELLYGPQSGWAEVEGVDVQQLLDDPQLQHLWDLDPSFLRRDLSASGVDYLLSADTDFFHVNSTTRHFPTGMLLAQLVEGFWTWCQMSAKAHLHTGALPAAVRELYGLAQDYSDLPAFGWYPEHWTRLRFNNPMRLFSRQEPILDAADTTLPFREVESVVLRREHTDVPLDTLTHSHMMRLEADQTAFGTTDSTRLRTNTTGVHIGELWPQGLAVTRNVFSFGAGTDWLSADTIAMGCDGTLLTAGSNLTFYRMFAGLPRRVHPSHPQAREAFFDLPAYSIPTYQQSFPVSADCDLGWVVSASSHHHVNDLDLRLCGVLPRVDYTLQSYFPARTDGQFTTDQTWMSADSVEAIFDLKERQLSPYACGLPNLSPPSVDTSLLSRKRWHNPWWVGESSTVMQDWPLPSALRSQSTSTGVPRSFTVLDNEKQVFAVENIPLGRRWLHLKDSAVRSLTFLPEEGRGYLPSAVLGSEMTGARLEEVAWSLLALCAQEREWLLIKVLQELIHVWAVELNNIVETLDGPILNDAVTWGLPPFLRRDGGLQTPDRDVLGLSWLGFALCHCAQFLRDRPSPQRLELPARLSLLLNQLAFLVANAVEPSTGWVVSHYNERGRLDGPTSFSATVMATIFLSSSLALEHNQEVHDRAVLAYLAIAESDPIPNPDIFGFEEETVPRASLYKLFWAAVFQEQLDVESLLAVIPRQWFVPEAGLFNLLVRELRLETEAIPVPENLTLAAQSWTILQEGRLELAPRDTFRLHAQEAAALSTHAFSLHRWMWPYGYRWLALEADRPGGGSLGNLLFALSFLSLFWAIRFFLFRDAQSISTSQGQALDLWGETLSLPRAFLQSDRDYRRRLLEWFRLERASRIGVLDFFREFHESPVWLNEPLDQLFEGYEERRGGGDPYDPRVVVWHPWRSEEEQYGVLSIGGWLYPMSADRDIHCNSESLFLPKDWPNRANPDRTIVQTRLRADATLLDWSFQRQGLPRGLRVTDVSTDASETWAGADTLMYLLSPADVQTTEVLTRYLNPEMAQQFETVRPMGVNAHLVHLINGQTFAVQGTHSGQGSFDLSTRLTGVTTLTHDLSLQPAQSEESWVQELTVEVELTPLDL